MQKAEAQHNQMQSRPAQRQCGVAALESPQGERIAQLEAMAEHSPQVSKQAQLVAMANDSSRMSAQRKAISAMHNSPNLSAQRQQLDSLTGETAQRAESPAQPSAPIQLSGREGDEWDPGPGQGESAPPTPRPVQGGQERPPSSEAESQIQDGYSPRAGEERDETAQLVAAGESLQLKVAQCADAPVKPNNTGLPDNLKNGIESLSGMSMDNVKVHYNSSQPAQLNALAYAQGTDIHVAPGQEQHLPHEAWHVVQQAQGRVKPTMQMKEGVPVNDDAGLEREADVMGVNALQMKGGAVVDDSQKRGSNIFVTNVVQRQLVVDVERAHTTEQEEVNVDALGYVDVLLKEYAQLMKDDASAIVKPRDAVSPSSKASAVKAVLEGVALDAEVLKAAFVSKLIAGNDWQELDGIRGLMQEKLSSNVDYQDEDGACMFDLSEDEVWQGVADSPTEYDLNLQEIIAEKVDADLSAVSTAGDLSGLDKYSEVWKRTLAFAAYEIGRKSFYPIVVGHAVAVASPQVPFLKLIGDLNAGLIEQLDFVEKYNSASGLGAEFEVALPGPKKTEYDGKAVVHTHYAAVDKKPNYGHTKPYANRKAKGYGYTTVNLGKINGMNDSQKKYNAL